MGLRRITGLRYVPVNMSNPCEPFPSSYYGVTDWPAEIAEMGLRWSVKQDGTCRIDHGTTEAFVLQENTNIILPHTIDGITVTEIAPCAFDILTPTRLPKEMLGLDFYLHSKSLTIPDSIEVIGNCGFSGLNPQVINIPANVYHIGNLGFYVNHFDAQTQKRQFNVDEDNLYYRSENGSLYTYDMETLMCQARPYPEVLHIPDKVSQFGLDTFAYGSKLPHTVYLPKTLKEIRTVPNRKCLWVCAQDSPAYRAAQRNGYYAVTERFGREGDYVYDILDSGEVTLINYQGEETNLVIPENFGGKPLSLIGPNPFPPNIRSIVFPDTVTAIAGNCPGIGLEKVTLPARVKTIGPGTFSESDFEKPVFIPQTCTSIGFDSFYRSICVFDGYDARIYLNTRIIMECFKDGEPPFNFAQYDESLLGLRDYPARLTAILLRITYPYALDSDTHRRFMLFLKGRQDEVIDHIIRMDDLRMLSLLLEEGFFAPEDIDGCVKRFEKVRYTQGIIQMIDYRHHNFQRRPEDRFSL